MTCPRCQAEFSAGRGSCPECGVKLLRNISGVIKTSAVLISSSGEDAFYGSLHEVPEPLRARLIEVTTSANSGTIVIADRAGKEQITHAMSRRETSRDRTPDRRAHLPLARKLLAFPWLLWAGALLILAAAGVIAAAFMAR